jgi:hypothetical protein
MATNVLGGLALEPFSDTNIEELHDFFESQANAGLYSFPLDTFKRVTVNDEDFNPEYSIVERPSKSSLPSLLSRDPLE